LKFIPMHPKTEESFKEPARMALSSDRDVADFLFRACHDLRAPLRSIRTQAELLVRDLGAGAGVGPEERLGFIVDGAQRIDLLVDGLAAYSITLRTGAEPFYSVGMEIVVRTALDLLEGELRARSAEVSCGRLPVVEGSLDRLVQLFENLIRNSLHHQGSAAPRIHIGAQEHEKEWLFAVSDNGPGVEAEYLEAIFKPFERLDPARHSGPGLGLAICRAIVAGHGGKIWCESKPGGGAAFLFTLPRIAR
jgi:signal transduction histidine kinase